MYFHFSTVHQDGNGEEGSLDILQHPYTCKQDQTRNLYDIRKPNNLNLKTTHDKKPISLYTEIFPKIYTIQGHLEL